MKREVGAQLDVDITEPTTLEVQIAVAPHPNTQVSESLSFVLNGRTVVPLEISGVHGNRIHKFDAPVGNLKVGYAATIVGQTDPAPVTEYDLSMYLRPSRYAEADKFFGFAATEFGEYSDSAALPSKVSSWVGTRLNYVPGSSDPIDGAARHLTRGVRCVPRLRASGGGVVAGGQCAHPSGFRVCAGASTRWTSTRWPRHSSTGDGGWSTRPSWRRGRHWCASPQDATRPTPPSSTIGAITLNNMEVTAVV